MVERTKRQSVEEFLPLIKKEWKQDLNGTCLATDTVESAVEKLIQFSYHRLWVVEPFFKVVGCVSLTDVIRGYHAIL